MGMPDFISKYFSDLKDEENSSLKRTFEGNFSDVGKFTILTERFINDDNFLFDKIIPEFIQHLEIESFLKKILNERKESLNKKIKGLFVNLELMPDSFDFYSYQIDHEEKSLTKLSYDSIKADSDCIFDNVVADVKCMNEASDRQSKDNYFILSLLSILYESFKTTTGESKKYTKMPKRENLIYKYYKSIDVDLLKESSQFSKYDLYSINCASEILVGLPSRVFDRENNLQFIIDTPEHILKLFVELLNDCTIKNLAFLAESEVIIESEEQYFIHLAGNRPTPPKFLSDLINDKRGNNVREEVIKKPKENTHIPHCHSVGRYFEPNSDDSVWYFIDENNIELEEIAEDFVSLDDCVVTQLIHIEYIVENDNLYISHIDHEYIFYTYHEFDQRLGDFTQKGEARKRIKTFKIDNSKIPLVLSNEVFFLYTVVDAYFSNGYFLKYFLLSIINKEANKKVESDLKHVCDLSKD